MQLISKFNRGICFLLCVIDIYSKYSRIVPLKDKNGITNAFQKMLNESKHKRNKIWVDKGNEFYKRSMKSWLEKNDIEMCSTHLEGKSVVAERFIRTLKNKIYIESSKEVNYQDPKFKIGHNVRISKYKNVFAKGYTPNLSEEVFVIKKVKNTVPWKYVISDLKDKEIVETFYEKEFQKTNQKDFRVEKVIRRKGYKLYVK